MSEASIPVRASLERQFGGVDIYIFDQLLKGRFDSASAVLDAGCGEGRNLHFLLSAGFDCHGVDRNPEAVNAVRALAARLAPALPPSNFIVGEIDALDWPDGRFAVVICSAVLHFARDTAHFDAMVGELWRVLAPGGMLLARLASVYPYGSAARRGGGRLPSPDGGHRYLVDAGMLLDRTSRLGGDLLDPLKTTVVHDQRSMTTWAVRKR